MRALITGVPGWLGNRFLEILIKGFHGEGAVRDWEIRCLTLKGVDTSFIQSLSKTRRIEHIAGDVARIESLHNVFEGVDIVFHMAGIIHPNKVSQLYEINFLGTTNVITKCVRNHVKKIIYISSNSVGGVNLSRDVLMKEDDTPRPYMNYGSSKFKAECGVKEAQTSGKIQTVILRPCWYYGPNQPGRQTTFFNMIEKGNPIIFGDGNNLRSMSYLDNVCEAMLLVAENDRANGQTYWIADARAYTSNEIYRTVAELLGVRVYKPRYVPDLISEGCVVADYLLQGMGCYMKELHVAGEMNKNIACSIEKAKIELGYDPKIELREGMRRSIEWCRQNGIEI